MHRLLRCMSLFTGTKLPNVDVRSSVAIVGIPDMTRKSCWPNSVENDPRLCENAKAINRDRTSYSFKTVSYAYIASAFNFEIEIKNIILTAPRTFEFSHGLDPLRTWR